MKTFNLKEINVYLDFEYNSLDREHESAQIIQSKFIVTDKSNNKIADYICNHRTDKTISASAICLCGIDPQNHNIKYQRKFDIFTFAKALKKALLKVPFCKKNRLTEKVMKENMQILGFSTQTDKKLLFESANFEQNMIDFFDSNYLDLSDIARLCPKYEKTIATQGSSLEVVNYILTGDIVVKGSSHGGIEEMDTFVSIGKSLDGEDQNDYLEYVPYGDKAGISIKDFCENNRRRADGIRYNNSNIFADALDKCIYDIEGEEEWY